MKLTFESCRKAFFEKPDLSFLLFLFGLRFALFLTVMIRLPFHVTLLSEEMVYSTVALELAHGDYSPLVIHSYGIPSFLFRLSGIFTSLFSRPIIGLAWFHFIMDIWTIPLTYLLGKELFSRRVGLIAAFFISFAPFYLLFTMGTVYQSSLMYLPGLLLVARARRRASWLEVGIGGLLIGLPTYGGRFASFVAAGAFFFLLVDKLPWRRKVASMAAFTGGFFISTVPLLLYTLKERSFGERMLSVFGSSGLLHLALPRHFLESIPSKIGEFLLPLFLFNIHVFIFFVPAMLLAIITVFSRKRRLADGDKFLWAVFLGPAAILIFVMTYIEPLFLVGVQARPLRYFSMFTPLMELAAASFLASRLKGKFSRLASVLSARRLLVAAAVLVVAAILGSSLPRHLASDGFFRRLSPTKETTVYSNTILPGIDPYYRNHSFPVDYRSYLEMIEKHRFSSSPALEFYGKQIYTQPMNLLYRYRRVPVRLKSWFLGMPAFSFKKLSRLGIPVGQERELWLYYWSKKKLLAENGRYQERYFRQVIAGEEESWDLMKNFNPDFDWRQAIVYKNDDEVLARVSAFPVAYRSLRLRFDRRSVEDPTVDFIVSSANTFLDELGFGWQTGYNLVVDGNWLNSMVDQPVTGGMRYLTGMQNEFRVRTLPGRYQVILEWKPDGEAGRLPLDFPGGELHAETRISAADGHVRSTYEISTDDYLTLSFGAGESFYLYRFELELIDE